MVWVVFTFFGFLANNAAIAQNPLDLLTGGDKAQGYTTPSPNSLKVKWWQEAIKNSPPEDPYFQLNQMADELQVYTDVEKYNLNNAAIQAISQFKNNLNQLTKTASSEVTIDPIVYEKKAAYSLAEIYAYKQRIRDIKNTQNQRQEDIDLLRNDAKAQNQAMDDLIVKHRNLPSESLTRLETGLLWIEARSWVALYERQVEVLVNKQALVDKQLLDLQNHLADAVQLIQPDVERIEELDELLTNVAEQIDVVSVKVQAANLKIASPEEDSIIGGFLTDIKKLELASHMLALNKLELQQVKAKAQFDWIRSTQPEMELDDDEVLKHVNIANLIKTKTEANQVKWKALAQDILISPALGPDFKKIKKIRDAALKRTRLAQELLLDLEDLGWHLEQVTFIEGLLTEQVIDSKSGLNRVWAQVKSYGQFAWSGFEKMANKTLFKINETPITLMPLLRLIIIVLIGYVVSKFVRFIIRRVEERRQVDKSSVFFILDKLIHYLIIFVATIAGFTTLGIDFTNLTLIAGALSVGIGFGLQNIVSNFVSGLTIMFERSLKVGDYIEMEDGFTGSVMEINARSTRINTNDNIDVVIPNSDLVTNKIINWTLRDSIKRVKIPFGVAYGTDKEKVRAAAIEAAENVSYTLTNMKGKEPEVWMTGFGDNSIDFVLLVWVSKYGVRRPNRIKASFLWELDTAFNKYKIEVPFPQRVIHYAESKIFDKQSEDDELAKDAK
ncbi:mechanosensitive ion channel family protein [Marinicella litoralis]|nr:mechanosensitive ion channel domain-containing protein [Marinicella litoralis]